MRLSVLISFLFISSAQAAWAQNGWFRLGKQAYIDADFKQAVLQLEKACALDSTNTYALFMLGYSYYHSDNYIKSISAFTKELNIVPTESDAFYYRALAKQRLSKDVQLTATDKEKYILSAILDFSKAITFSPENKLVSCYQNRGLAYREYGLFKLQANLRTYDKATAIKALKASIADLERILATDATRSDIAAQLDLSKEKLASVTSINSHHKLKN